MRYGTFVMTIVAAMALSPKAISAENTQVGRIKYLHGVPTHPTALDGMLRIGPDGLVFASRRTDRFTLDCETVDYVAAFEGARQRALMADIGFVVAAKLADMGARSAAIAIGHRGGFLNLNGLFIPLLGAAPFAALLREKDKHLLSVEYLVGEPEFRRLVLFAVNEYSATAVKRLIDQACGLRVDYYREKDQKDEANRRAFEQSAKPVGSWEAPRDTVVGDRKRRRILVAKGSYDVLLCFRYIGLKPRGMSWAKYRLPVREVEAVRDKPSSFQAIYKGSRLIGFEVAGYRSLFY